MHPNKMRRKIKGFEGGPGRFNCNGLQMQQKSVQNTAPAAVTISGIVTMLRTVEISTVWTAYS